MDVRSLTDQELLSVILGTGTQRDDVYDLSSRLYRTAGSLRGLSRSGIRELCAVPGIGVVKAVRILSSLELGRRMISESPHGGMCDSPARAWKELQPILSSRETEAFAVLVLDTRNRVLRKQVVSTGTINESIVHPREVYREAIRESGSGIIIAHNHPSGDTSPSRDDIRTTERIKKAGEVLGIKLVDHIIFTDHSYLSLREEGYMD